MKRGQSVEQRRAASRCYRCPIQNTSTLLEIARAYARLPQPPRRSVLFVFVTGEVMGLLGSDYFAHFATVPLKSIVANVNIDGAPGSYFAMKEVVALQPSTPPSEMKSPPPRKRWATMSRPIPCLRKSASSAAISIPSFSKVCRRSTSRMASMRRIPKSTVLQPSRSGLVTRYHTPLDNMDQPIDFDAMAKGSVLNFLVGYQIAQHDPAPTWNKGDFFGTTFGPRHAATIAGE